MKKQTMTYEAPELYLISVCVEKGFAASSGIEPGTGGGELGGTRSLSYDCLLYTSPSPRDCS